MDLALAKLAPAIDWVIEEKSTAVYADGSSRPGAAHSADGGDGDAQAHL
jgi:hypothetical protein